MKEKPLCPQNSESGFSFFANLLKMHKNKGWKKVSFAIPDKL